MRHDRALEVQIWIPTVFAGFLTAVKLLMPAGRGDTAYFCFLPLCFFFVAAAQLALLKRLGEPGARGGAEAPVAAKGHGDG